MSMQQAAQIKALEAQLSELKSILAQIMIDVADLKQQRKVLRLRDNRNG